VDVTAQVQKVVAASGVATGICYLYVPHTTAAITINECADPDVARDVEGALDRLIPVTGPYRHSEGNSDSHVRRCSWELVKPSTWKGASSCLGAGKAFSSASLMVPASDGSR
jgi:secondary thiamine-phosphate synthase enzyme